MYVAMTRGQESLIADLARRGQRRRTGDGSITQKLLRVLTASAEELAAHEQVLAAIQKESKGNASIERRAGRLTSLRRDIALLAG